MLPVHAASLLRSFLACFLLFASNCKCQVQTVFTLNGSARPTLLFSRAWHSLGPFRIGTREAIWGADPLEVVGGFVNIPYDEHSSFRSSLTANATVHWTSNEFVVEHDDDRASVHFGISHGEVDWNSQQQAYGWSALQYQTWTRGILKSHSSETRKAWIYPEGILEFFVNGQHFFGGDFFSFNRAAALIDIQPGTNIFDIRLIRDVRAMGGTNPPTINAKIQVRLAGGKVEIDHEQVNAPDIVNGRLPSRYLSFPVRNPLPSWIHVSDCQQDGTSILKMLSRDTIKIAPGQVRPVALQISQAWNGSANLFGALCYFVEDTQEQSQQSRLPFFVDMRHSSITDVSKFTFLHPSGAVSYAILKPPATRKEGVKIPLLVLLHGAGLEADSCLVRHSLDTMPDLDAFAIFPTGMSPWSGDDWHLWGTADVLSAIEAVHGWMVEMGWEGTIATTNRVFVAGHSNGGQGAWFFATHLPDRTVAAAPQSGYSSIENYVPYSLWREADPLQDNALNTARTNYRHELLLDNLAYTPVLQQHGSADDNVPPYHSRLMSSLRLEAGLPSDYIEMAGKPHWWDGAMTTMPLQNFYRRHLKYQEHLHVPEGNFTIVVPSCGAVGSKFGIVVDQLQNPDRLGRIEVFVSGRKRGQSWQLETTNIHRLHFDFVDAHVQPPLLIRIDRNAGPSVIQGSENPSQNTCIKSLKGDWQCLKGGWKGLDQRYGRQRGALDAILQSRGAFEIVSCIDDINLPVQVSRNFFQYYGADSAISPCDQYAEALKRPGNVILLAVGDKVPCSQLHGFPITLSANTIVLRVHPWKGAHAIDNQPGIGAIFLRPLSNERLELIVWGSDFDGLTQAARLVPTVTGAGQPDFVILGPKAKFQGHGGTIAMGFFDYHWNISKASYLPA